MKAYTKNKKPRQPITNEKERKEVMRKTGLEDFSNLFKDTEINIVKNKDIES